MEQPDLAEAIEAAAAASETLATAESLTGGRVAAAVTAVPGCSRVYVGGVVSYATRLKVDLLDVPEVLVAEHGVVSAECAAAMAEGVTRRLGATWGLATTGVAGPGPSDGVPAGTAYVALAGPTGTHTRRLVLSGGREDVAHGTVEAALDLWLAESRGRREGASGASGSVDSNDAVREGEGHGAVPQDPR